MIFKPKIFISSTFKENESIRDQIQQYFNSIGAEPLLYESVLTPSTVPMTYRTNLLDADFMILIVKEEYGTKTELGLSGIHEEYKIARNRKIPLHVYLKKNDNNSEDNPLIKDLKKDGISYYYFDSDKNLLKRLKETTFTIAKEIMLSQIDKSEIPSETIKSLAGNMDYTRAMQVISIIESMNEVVSIYEIDWITSNIFTACVDPISYGFTSHKHNFLNWKIDELLTDMLKIASDFMQHAVLDFTSNGNYKEYHINVLGPVQITNLSYNKNTDWNPENYTETLKKFFKAYKKFKNAVQDVRTEIDKM